MKLPLNIGHLFITLLLATTHKSEVGHYITACQSLILYNELVFQVQRRAGRSVDGQFEADEFA